MKFFQILRFFRAISIVLLLFVLLVEIFLKLYSLQPYDFLKLSWLKLFLSMNDAFVKNLMKERVDYMSSHEFLGYVLTPNSRLKAYSPEYSITYDIQPAFPDETSIGVNDETTVEDSIYALAFGDSFTFCWGVERENCWVETLEKKLGKEVKNFGVFGYGFMQKFRLFSLVMEKLKKKGVRPKEVLFQLISSDMHDDLCFLGKIQYCHPVHPLLFFYGKGKISSIFLVFDLVVNEKWKLKKIPEHVKKDIISRYRKMMGILHHTSEEHGFSLLWIVDDKFPIGKIMKGEKITKVVFIPSQKEFYFNVDEHLNVQGNKELAQRVYEKISSSILP